MTVSKAALARRVRKSSSEEFLSGEEASFFCLCDGTVALPFGTAQDHKRVGEGDTGPNTGGMGAYSPASIMDEAMIARVMGEIIEPTMRGMKTKRERRFEVCSMQVSC